METVLERQGKSVEGVKEWVTVIAALLTLPIWILPYFVVRGVRWLSAHVGQMKKTLIGAGVIVAGAFAVVYGAAVQFSVFTAGPLMAVIGVALFYVLVRYGHNEIDTIKELTECRNEAVARHFFSYAFIIALVLCAALVAGF